MLKQAILMAGIALSLNTHAAVVTSDQNVGTPLVTGSIQFFNGIVGPNSSFVHSVHFTTDGNAEKGSGAVIGLELDGVSGFIGPLTISLYEDNYVTGDNTSALSLVQSVSGTNLNNINVKMNTNYSFVIEGVTDSTPNNAFSGSVAVSGVPIPAAAWMFSTAIIGLGCIGRTRRLDVN